MKKVELIVIGAGDRGSTYASYAKENPDRAAVVGVAEPREKWRNRLVVDHDIPESGVADHWMGILEKPKFADAVVIATQDSLHVEPAIAFAEKGYHVLLEKPMAIDPGGCRRVVEAVAKAGVIFGVCHVLRYTPYTRKLREILDEGSIGDVVSVQHLEPVGYWHQAHSFVRGNWRNEKQSSPMLLAKCCHDVDWISYIVGSRCESVQSFGTLKHFRPESKPPDAADRCVDCDCEARCPYSAKRIYLDLVEKGQRGWPVNVLVPEVTRDSVLEAIKTGPYGRCVYDCDNDVVDNQVVNMLFETGQTASMTMTAFTESGGRRTRIFGTRGQLEGDGSIIRRFDFLTDTWHEIETGSEDNTILGGHGGGDGELMRAFVEAVANDDPARILSGPRETLESHMMVFAAEKSRNESRVVEIGEMLDG